MFVQHPALLRQRHHELQWRTEFISARAEQGGQGEDAEAICGTYDPESVPSELLRNIVRVAGWSAIFDHSSEDFHQQEDQRVPQKLQFSLCRPEGC